MGITREERRIREAENESQKVCAANQWVEQSDLKIERIMCHIHDKTPFCTHEEVMELMWEVVELYEGLDWII